MFFNNKFKLFLDFFFQNMLINIRNKENRSTPLSSKEVYNTIMDIKLKQVSLSPIFFIILSFLLNIWKKNEVIEIIWDLL